MTTRRIAPFAACLLVASLTGCFTLSHEERIEFPNSSINGQTARIALDTGAEASLFLESAARRANAKFSPSAGMILNQNGKTSLTEPIRLVLGSRAETARLQVAHLRLPWFVRGTPDIDGLIGWPEVRGNILQFDPATRVVRRLDAVPPEALGWLKLKVLSRDTLHFEMPLATGKPLEIFVDTGDAAGVGVPAPYWSEWEKSNPGKKSEVHYGGGVGTGGYSWREFAGADITIGPLSLTDVSVYDFGTHAMFGLETLSRVELIVDGPAGLAYLKPLPRASDQSVTTVASSSWKVDSSVQVDFARINAYALYVEANGKRTRKDFAGAIADYDRATDLDPRFYSAFAERGVTKRQMGDNAAALADFERAVAIFPDHSENVYRRAFTKQLLGDYAGALVDYDRYIELAPGEWHSAYLIRQILEQRLGRPVSEFDTDKWDERFKAAARYLAGSLSEAEFLAVVAKSKGPSPQVYRSYAHYFVAMKRQTSGDTAGAIEYFRKVMAMEDQDGETLMLSKAELARLGK